MEEQTYLEYVDQLYIELSLSDDLAVCWRFGAWEWSGLTCDYTLSYEVEC